MLERRVERALTCHNGALTKVAMLLSDDVPTRLHHRISLILEKMEKLKSQLDAYTQFHFPGAHPTGRVLKISQLMESLFENTQEHDEMIRNFLEKLCDAQFNLQVIEEDETKWENEEVVRRSRNSRRELIRSSTNDPDSPAYNDGSIDVLDRPVCSPTLSLMDETIAQPPQLEEQQNIAPMNLNDSVHDATSTETNDMDLTEYDADTATPTNAISDPKSIDIDIRFSSLNDASVDSLISPDQRRTSSSVRLYTSPPKDAPKVAAKKSFPPPSPLATEKAAADSILPVRLSVSEDEEPRMKKLTTSVAPEPSSSEAPAAPTRGSRQSKVAPKKKRETTKKGDKEAEKKNVEVDDGKRQKR